MPEENISNEILDDPEKEPTIYENEPSIQVNELVKKSKINNNNASLIKFETKSPSVKRKKVIKTQSSDPSEENNENEITIITEIPEQFQKYNHTCIVMNSHEYLVHHIMKYISFVIDSEYIKNSEIYNTIVRLIKKRVPKNIITVAKCSQNDTYDEKTGIKISRIKARKRMFEKELAIWNDISEIFCIKNEEEYNKIIEFIEEKINKLTEEYNEYLN